MTNKQINKKSRWLPFDKAKEIVHQNQLKSLQDWHKWSKEERPKNIPSAPDKTYKEFSTWRDWIGNKEIKARKHGFDYLSYAKAKNFVKNNSAIRTKIEYDKWMRSDERPHFLPSAPDIYYKNKWVDWPEFLSTKKRFLSYNKAREWMVENNINNNKKFLEAVKTTKLPKNIPTAPLRVYKKEYIGLWHFLGFDKKHMEYDEFIDFVKSKKDINSLIDYFKWSSTIERPCNVPNRADLFYKRNWKEISKDIF